MGVYHEVEPDNLEATLLHGLRQGKKSDKSDDPVIAKTDTFLDEHCLGTLKKQGVKRDANIYGYVEVNGEITQITNGKTVPVSSYLKKSKRPILELHIDPHRVFVSDLDTYDALKDAIEHHENKGKLSKLAESYWKKLVSLDKYIPGSIRRPEVIITYNLGPEDLKLVTH